jgi:hypothetical protein
VIENEAETRLAREVQDAATSLGIPFPKSLRLPAMPDLEKPTKAFLVTSCTQECSGAGDPETSDRTGTTLAAFLTGDMATLAGNGMAICGRRLRLKASSSA